MNEGKRSATLKLAEEADIVLGEETQVLHAVFEVGDTLDTHTERITAVLFAVDAAGFQHIRIHHAAAEDLHPAGSFAERATYSAADITRDIHFGTGFGEGEIGRTKTNLRFGSEHLFGEIEQGFAQVGKADVLVDIQSFDLMEEAVRTRRDRFIAVHSSGA